MSIKKWDAFFKSSARSAGDRFYNEGQVSFSQPSGTEVVAYIKPSSTSFKVTLKSAAPQDHTIIVSCTCPQSKKAQFCKHIWGALRAVTEKSPEFFENKSELQINSTQADSTKANAYAKSQADYRKQQYEKQKQRAKDFKKSKNSKSKLEPEWPETVQLAFDYFNKNGFSLETSLTEEAIYLARKKLSRVFHPDVGGSHAEILQLNHNVDLLLKYLGSKN